MEDEYDEISLEMAIDIGLVPDPRVTTNLDVRGYSGLFFFESEKAAERRQAGAERAYRDEKQRVIDEYCVDKGLRLCRFRRSEIMGAVKRRMSR